MDICVFSKHLQEWDFSELGRNLKRAGFDGVDLTVRPGGHIEPETAADQLPEAAALLAQEGVHVSMITTAITSVEEPHARTLLETASRTGIRYFKIGYYLYDGFRSLRKGLGEAAARLRDIAALSGELGLWGGFHNHSGPYLGAHVAHVRRLLDDLDPNAIGSYFDIGHATVEGAAQGYLLGLDELADRIRMLALKDFVIRPEPAAYRGSTVPMGEGLVAWTTVVDVLKEIAPKLGPVSYHGEYKNLTAEEVLAQVVKDKAFFEGLWA